MDQDESTIRLNRVAHVFARRIVRSNGRADGDAAVFRDLRGDIADAADVDVTMLFGKTQLRGKIFADQAAIEQRHRTSSDFQEFCQQHVGDRRLS